MTVSIAAIVPTRNRPDLAIEAVRSLVDQDCALELFVSDNSTSPDRGLLDFCRGLGGRVTLLRAPASLQQAAHWDWALRQAMKRSGASHFTIHYDRKYSKPNAWGGIARAAARYPGDLLSFPVDQIASEPPPLRLWQAAWTGKLYSIDTVHAAGLLARGRVAEIANAVPLLSNCVVPREIVEAIAGRFGNVCDSTSPDTAFMARFFALRDRWLLYDRPLGIVYGSKRSSGLGYLRGAGGDFSDFMQLSGDRPHLDAAPLPGVNLGSNMLYHEYELVRRATGDRLPPLDRPQVLRELGSALQWIADPELKASLGETLKAQGWTGVVPPAARRRWPSVVHEWVRRHLLHRLGTGPRGSSGFSFRSDEEALAHALRFPGRPRKSRRHIALLEPEEAGSPAPG